MVSTNRQRWFSLIGAGSGFLTVVLGAFGAHALSSALASNASVWQTAVHYQMFHTLALFVVALLPVGAEHRLASAAGWLFVAGMVLFCGSLYVFALTGAIWLGMITPVGGVLFLFGWGCLVVALARRTDEQP